jgi:hypothetical protein
MNQVELLHSDPRNTSDPAYIETFAAAVYAAATASHAVKNTTLPEGIRSIRFRTPRGFLKVRPKQLRVDAKATRAFFVKCQLPETSATFQQMMATMMKTSERMIRTSAAHHVKLAFEKGHLVAEPDHQGHGER